MRKNLITILSLVMAVTLVGVNVYADPEKATETVVIEEVATEEKTTEEAAEEKSAEETTTEEKAEETTSEESAKGAEEKEAATEEELEELLKEAKDASEATPEDYFTFDSTTGTLTNFHPKEAIETLVIPAKIGGVEVKHIAWWLGQDMTDATRLITKLVLPPTLESIKGSGVFRTFGNLETIEGLDYLLEIGPQAFDKSPKLQYSLSENTKLTELKMYVFYQNYFRTPEESTTVLPNSIVKYHLGALQGTRAPELIIGNQTHIFGDNVLWRTQSHNIGLPTTLTTTGENTFIFSPVRTLIMYSASNTKILEESEYDALLGEITKPASQYSSSQTNVVIIDSLLDADETDVTTEVGKTLGSKDTLSISVEPALTSLVGPAQGTTQKFETRQFDKSRLGEYYFTEKEKSIYLKNFTEAYSLFSDDPSVIRVDGDSLVAVGEGTATITIRSLWNPARMKTVKFTVDPAPIVPPLAPPSEPSEPISPVRPDSVSPAAPASEEIRTDGVPLANIEDRNDTNIAAEEIVGDNVPKTAPTNQTKIMSAPKTGSRELWRAEYLFAFAAIVLIIAIAPKKRNK